ncbi:MAG: nucleoside deaminase [Bacteroidota bacterium]
MKLSIHSDEHFMRQAYLLAEQAYEENEVPIGAVIVSDYQIIGKGYNQTERLQDPTAHAEMIALTAACEYFNSKYLPDCTIYVTVEPCPMCAGAIKWAQLSKVVYGAEEPKFGFRRYKPFLLHPKATVVGGIMEEECSALMKDFFKHKRGK